VTRRCFLFGFDPVSGKNFDHRKVWIEEQSKTQAANFGIDLLSSGHGDKGFLSLSTLDYLELLDETARITRADWPSHRSRDTQVVRSTVGFYYPIA